MSRTPLRPRSAYCHWVPITTRWHDNDVYGHFTHVYVGRDSRRPVPLPPASRTILERLF